MKTNIPLFLTLILFASCANDQRDKSSGLHDLEKNRSKLVGKWSVAKWVSNGKNLDVANDRQISITFNKDGTHVTIGHIEGEPDKELLKDFWRIEEEGSIAFYTDPGEVGNKESDSRSTYRYRFSGDTLILDGRFNESHDVVYHIPKAYRP